MKKIWRIRRDSEAVSPVIATILMVAITVVLAAVLYVMVMGFGGTGAQTPTGAFTEVTKISSTQYKVTFGVVSPDTKFIDCKVRIDPTALSQVTTAWTYSLSSGLTVASTGTTPGITVTDIGADGKISVGDYVAITIHTAPGTVNDNGDWTLTLIYASTGGSIATKIVTVSGNP